MFQNALVVVKSFKGIIGNLFELDYVCKIYFTCTYMKRNARKRSSRHRKRSSVPKANTDIDSKVLEAIVHKGVEWSKPSDLGDHVLKLGEHQFAFNIVGQNAVNVYFHVNGVGQRDDYKVDKKTGVISAVKRIPTKTLTSVAVAAWLPLLICFLMVTAVFVICRLATGQSFGAADVAAFWNEIWMSFFVPKPLPWYTSLYQFVGQGASSILNSNPMQTLLNSAATAAPWFIYYMLQQYMGVSGLPVPPGGQTLGAAPALHPGWGKPPPSWANIPHKFFKYFKK